MFGGAGYNAEDAQDLTQEFFARLIAKNYPDRPDRAKGKFRSFLLLRLKHFLADEHDRANSRKRSGGHLSFRWTNRLPKIDTAWNQADDLTPEKIFDRRWAQTRTRRGHRPSWPRSTRPRERRRFFAVLKAFQPGEQKVLSYEDAAARLGVTESAIKSMIHRLRQRHRELVREQIAHTVSTAAEIDDELRHLITVISC
jgi:RNA polymerase sigma-70 factor (ECF subfamily)